MGERFPQPLPEPPSYERTVALLRADLGRANLARQEAEAKATKLQMENRQLRNELHAARDRLNAIEMERRATAMGMPD